MTPFCFESSTQRGRGTGERRSETVAERLGILIAQVDGSNDSLANLVSKEEVLHDLGEARPEQDLVSFGRPERTAPQTIHAADLACADDTACEVLTRRWL